MSNSFSMDEETRQFFIYQMEELAKVDGNYGNGEKEIIDGLKRSFNVTTTVSKISKPLSKEEQIVFLRELYKLSISDLEYDPSEEAFIKKFAKDNDIPDILFEATKQWALSILDADLKYFDSIEQL